jgi:hypothetical protein
MQLSDRLPLMKDYPSSAEFYVQSPFHNSRFLLVACCFVLDLCLCAFVLVGCWRHSNLQVASFMAFVIIFLVAAWRLGFRTHEQIHMLFETGQIGKLEKGSALDKTLSATTGVLLGLLFATFVLAGSSLAALGQVLLSR